MKEVMSLRTWVVGPVLPRSDGFVTERPHPLVNVSLGPGRVMAHSYL